MPTFPSQGGSRNSWGTELRNFFSPFFDLVTGLFRANVIPGAAIKTGEVTDTQLATPTSGKTITNGDSHDHSGGDGAQIDHTTLANPGTNTHAQIDTFVASKAAASGLASLDGSSKVAQNPANATATPTADKIPIADGGGKLDAWVSGATPTFSTQNVVTGSRVIGTVYRNTSGKTMFVIVSSSSSTGSAYAALTDAATPPTTEVVRQNLSGTGTNLIQVISFMVLNNNYYKVTWASGTPTLNFWTEWV